LGTAERNTNRDDESNRGGDRLRHVVLMIARRAGRPASGSGSWKTRGPRFQRHSRRIRDERNGMVKAG
jgi:hypothetical protein